MHTPLWHISCSKGTSYGAGVLGGQHKEPGRPRWLLAAWESEPRGVNNGRKEMLKKKTQRKVLYVRHIYIAFAIQRGQGGRPFKNGLLPSHVAP